MATYQGPQGPVVFSVSVNESRRGRDSVTFNRQGYPTETIFVNFKSGREDITVHRGGAVGPVVATADFGWGSKTDLVFHSGAKGGKTTMKLGGIGSTGGLFVSKSNHVTLPAAPGPKKDCTWKGTTRKSMLNGSDGSLELVDGSGQALAHFNQAQATLDVAPGSGPEFVDQVITTAMAIWEKTRRDKKRTHAGGP